MIKNTTKGVDVENKDINEIISQVVGELAFEGV